VTAEEYIRATALSVAYASGVGQPQAAIVGILHVLRNRAETAGNWSEVLASEPQIFFDTRLPDFRRVAEIADQIIGPPLSEPCPRLSNVGKSTKVSLSPASNAIKIGDLYFFS
jgi:hypothetical protein